MILLQYDTITIWHYYTITLLQYDSITLLRYYNMTLLRYYAITLLHYYSGFLASFCFPGDCIASTFTTMLGFRWLPSSASTIGHRHNIISSWTFVTRLCSRWRQRWDCSENSTGRLTAASSLYSITGSGASTTAADNRRILRKALL